VQTFGEKRILISFLFFLFSLSFLPSLFLSFLLSFLPSFSPSFLPFSLSSMIQGFESGPYTFEADTHTRILEKFFLGT
jgi:hypothetical protein